MSAHDFDFLPGRWAVRNRRLVDILDPDCDEWTEFDATSVARCFGLGNIDHLTATLADGTPMEGMSLRLYEPAADRWRIWWASSRFPGVLDPPVEGRFVDGVGTFYGDDTVGGRPVRVRYRWQGTDSDHPQWDQAFSSDGGTTWSSNWEMIFTREG